MDWWNKVAAMLKTAKPEVCEKVNAAMQKKRELRSKRIVKLKKPGKPPRRTRGDKS